MKRLCTAVLCLLLIGSLCSCGGSDPAANEDPTTSVSKEEVPETTNSLTVSNFGSSELFQEMKNILEDTMGDYSPSITYDRENALVNVMIVAPDGSASALVTNKYAVESAWNSLTESLTEVSLSGYDLLSGSGLDIGCSVIVLSDVNPDKVLFGAVNGLEVYDIFDE